MRSSRSDVGSNENPINTIWGGHAGFLAPDWPAQAATARPSPRSQEAENSGATWVGGVDSAGKAKFPRRRDRGLRRNEEPSCPLTTGSPRKQGSLPSRPARSWVRKRGRVGGGVRWGAKASELRILPQAGVHLALVGPGLPVAPVFLIHELVLVVLITSPPSGTGPTTPCSSTSPLGPAARPPLDAASPDLKPSPSWKRRLAPPLPSSAQRRSRQPRSRVVLGLRAGALLPSQARAFLDPLPPPRAPQPGAPGQARTCMQRACADSLRERGGAGRQARAGGAGQEEGEAVPPVEVRGAWAPGPSTWSLGVFHRNASLRSSLGGVGWS